MARGIFDREHARLATKKKNLIVRLALNPSYRTYGWLGKELGIKVDNPQQEIVDIKSTVEKMVDRTVCLPKIEQKVEDNVSGIIKDLGLVESHGLPLRKDSVFNPKLPGQTCELATRATYGCEQLATAQYIFDQIYYDDCRGQLLIAPGGSGKTYILGSIIGNLIANGFLDDCLSPWPVLYLTKLSIVSQTKDVLRDEFGLDVNYNVHVENIEAIRAALLGTLIEEIAYVEAGVEVKVYRWRRNARPKLIVIDEAQSLAREEALQTQIMNSIFIDEDGAPWKTYEVLASATPGSRIIELKHFALSTKKVLEFSSWAGKELIESNAKNWNLIKRGIISDAAPGAQETDYNPAVMKEFVEHYKDRIIWIKDVVYRHKGYLHFLPITFETEALREEYNTALEEHKKRKAKLEGEENVSEVALLASYTIFAKAAEYCKRYFVARWINDQWSRGLAPAFGFRFKRTATGVMRILFEDFNWSRDDISIVWGGSVETLNDKKKLAKRIKNAGERGMELLDELGINLSDDLGIDLNELNLKTDEQLEWEKQHKLLTQTPEAREEERLRFVRQDSKCALFSYKSGGVGLSLHHQKKYPKARQRTGIFTPDYSEKLGVQALYRLPRLTSASDTHMFYCYYETSIEREIMEKFLHKCRSLQELTREKEFWTQEEGEDLVDAANIVIESK